MPNKKIPTSFAISLYGNLQPYPQNPALSKTRARTFYKRINRNGSFITDEIAAGLIANAPGSPIVGHYDEDKADFTSHMGVKNSKAYGFIPIDNPGFAWEQHLDNDGIMREYACFDVLLWTGRYEEAKKIPGKSQSMELDPKSVKGEWRFENNVEAFFYIECNLSGLCVLGEEIEPCFEGAAFYNLDVQFSEYLDAMREEIVKNFALQTNNLEGGKKKMPIKFNLPHENNFETLFNLMNPKFNEENEFLVEFMVHTVSEKQLYAYSYADKKNYLVEYTTNEEGVVSIGEPQELTTVFGLTADEQSALPEFVVNNGGIMINNITAKIEEYELKIEEMKTQLEEKDGAIAEFTAAGYQEKIDVMGLEVSALKNQLTAYEDQAKAAIATQKDALIDSYANLLDADEIAKYKTSKDTLSVDELEGKLAVQFARKYRGKDENVKLPGNNQQSTKSSLVMALEAYKNKKGE